MQLSEERQARLGAHHDLNPGAELILIQVRKLGRQMRTTRKERDYDASLELAKATKGRDEHIAKLRGMFRVVS